MEKRAFKLGDDFAHFHLPCKETFWHCLEKLLVLSRRQGWGAASICGREPGMLLGTLAGACRAAAIPIKNDSMPRCQRCPSWDDVPERTDVVGSLEECVCVCGGGGGSSEFESDLNWMSSFSSPLGI